jgi:hypothetical protein
MRAYDPSKESTPRSGLGCSIPECGRAAAVVLAWNHVAGSNVLLLMCAACSRITTSVQPDLVVTRPLPPRRRQRPA